MRAIRARRALLGIAVLTTFATSAPRARTSSPTGTRPPPPRWQSPGTAIPPGPARAPSPPCTSRWSTSLSTTRSTRSPAATSRLLLARRRAGFSQDAAVAAAARHVLLNGGLNGAAGFAPARVTRSRPPTRHARQGPAGPAKAGIATGVAAATGMIAARAGTAASHRRLHVPDRHAARRVAADERRQRPRRLAEGRHAVRASRSGPVPRAAAVCAPHEGLCRRLQRGEGDRARDRLDPDAGPDGRGELSGA